MHDFLSRLDSRIADARRERATLLDSVDSDELVARDRLADFARALPRYKSIFEERGATVTSAVTERSLKFTLSAGEVGPSTISAVIDARHQLAVTIEEPGNPSPRVSIDTGDAKAEIASFTKALEEMACRFFPRAVRAGAV